MSTEQDLIILNSALTQLMRWIRRVDERQGLGRARLSALAVLHFGGACSLSDLAESEMVSRATMHHVVKGLENEGLVRRTADDGDARRQVIRLTRRGSRLIQSAHGARIAYLQRLAADLDPVELATTAKVLDQLRVNARQDSEL
jgi:DNA-binding MarR family transcriptional regulator